MRFLGLMFFCSSVMASDLWWVATLTSHHFSSEKYNQHNYGLGFESETRFNRLSVIGGGYDNSYKRTSAYAGMTFTPLALGPIHLGAIGGFISGYRSVIAVLPTAQIEYERIGFNVYYAPQYRDSCAVLGLQVKGRF